MVDASGRWRLIFNGEIYNFIEIRDELVSRGHRFSSSTDSEVLLAAYVEWGRDALPRFNGMWAFAIWDSLERRFFCARDRLGVKPFHFVDAGDLFAFASEINALRPVFAAYGLPLEPDEGVASEYLMSTGLDRTDRTFLNRVRRLSPGHWLVADGQGVSTGRYWELPHVERRVTSEEATIVRFGELFGDAVRLRLRADIPVGSCLSGGLDSSAIVGTASEILRSTPGSAPLATVSAVWEDVRYDESRWIDIVVARSGATSHRVRPDGNRLFDRFEEFVRSSDEPVASSSSYAQYCVFEEARRNGLKVMLDGQGADELLGGYGGAWHAFFIDLAVAGEWSRLSREFGGYRRTRNQPWSETAGAILRGWVRSRIPSGLGAWISKKRHDQGASGFAAKRIRVMDEEAPGVTRLEKLLRGWVTGSSLQPLLRYEDRNSMAFGVESRVPFLDYRLVEFAQSLPPTILMRDGLSKWILRRAVGALPREIAARPDKVGFATPEREWLHGPGRERLIEVVESRSFAERGLFDVDAARAALRTFLAGPKNVVDPNAFWRDANPLWRCLVLETWCRIMMAPEREAS